MKSFRKELWFNIPSRRGLVSITPEVNDCLRESGIREGLCLVNAMNITSSVFINDDEGGLHQDFEEWLEGLAPHEPVGKYRHNLTGEDNADAHLKRSVMGREVVVAVTDAAWISAPGSRSFISNSMASVRNTSWSRSSGNRKLKPQMNTGLGM